MSNKLNPFEEHLRKSVENHSVPYDASQWNKLVQKLDAPMGNSSNLFQWGWSAVAIAVVCLGTLSILGGKNPSVVEPIGQIEADAKMDTEVTVINNLNEVKQEPVNETTHFASKKEVEASASNVVQAAHTSSMEESVSNQSFTQVSSPEIKRKDEAKEDKKLVESVNNTVESGSKELVKIQISSTEICAGLPIQAHLDEIEHSEVIWYLGDGVELKAKSINHVYLNAGEYDLKAFLPKTGEYTETVTIHVKSKPNAEFSVRTNLEREMIPVKYISVNKNGAAAYHWNLGDGTVLAGEGISHVYRKQGTYEISLRATNSNGCSWTMHHTVEIEKDFNLLAPNSFTPNGDGLNDTWIPKALTTDYYTYQLQVYDRKGSLVFESTNPENKFDGRVNGQMAEPGSVFIWKAITTDPSGVQQEFGGNLIAYP